MPKVRSAQDWVDILNSALKALRDNVDDSGNGVFRLPDVFGPIGLEPQTNTISRHLQNLRLLSPVEKQSNGVFLWRVDLKKKRVTLQDVKKARDIYARRQAAESGANEAKGGKKKPTQPRRRRRAASAPLPVPPASPTSPPPVAPPSADPDPTKTTPQGSDLVPPVTATRVRGPQHQRTEEQLKTLVEIVVPQLESKLERKQARIDVLEAENAELKARVNELTASLEVAVDPELDRAAEGLIERYS